MGTVAESVLAQVEQDHRDGITSADLLAFFKAHGVRFGEATLRKWVQIGLLPRSKRVGQKGKHKGSKGMYPIRVVRQILHIKELMARDLTIEDIQNQYLFVRGDLEVLEQTLKRVFTSLDEVVARPSTPDTVAQMVAGDVEAARALSADLLKRLERIEAQLIPDDDESVEAAAS